MRVSFALLASLIMLSVTLGVFGCASSGLSSAEFEAQIPDTAFEIHLYSQKTPDDFLGFIRRNLEMQGFNVVRYSAVDQNLATAPTAIGRQLSLSVFVTVTQDLDVSRSLAVISGLQGRDAAIVGSARWNQTGDDQAYAFSRLAQTANRIDHERLIYAVAAR